MRKLLIPLLLASALAPAAASAEEGGLMRALRAHAERADRDRPSDSSSSNDNRPQRAERSSESERPARIERAERPQRIERAEPAPRLERADQPAQIQHVERINSAGDVEQIERPARAERIRRINRDRNVERRAESPAIQAEPVQEVRTVEPVQQTQSQTRQSSGSRFVDGLRSGVRDHPELKRRERERERWRDEWRRDHRYDWWSYRNRYGSLFQLGHYYDPYGWGYRRWSIGFNLWPSYYGSHYWLNDPWRYRLPPAYGPYRWVRYYDDALLVNIYTGEVEDVIYNFFW